MHELAGSNHFSVNVFFRWLVAHQEISAREYSKSSEARWRWLRRVMGEYAAAARYVARRSLLRTVALTYRTSNKTNGSRAQKQNVGGASQQFTQAITDAIFSNRQRCHLGLSQDIPRITSGSVHGCNEAPMSPTVDRIAAVNCLGISLELMQVHPESTTCHSNPRHLL